MKTRNRSDGISANGINILIDKLIMPNTYFDNAATSFPKPAAVAERMSMYLNMIGGTYGRSAYPRVVDASTGVETARELLAERLGVDNADHVVFSFNATTALNTVLSGLQLHDCHILISPLEHNAVTRPLEALRVQKNVHFEILPHGNDGLIDIDQIAGCIRDDTKLVIVNHQGNVNGLIQPVAKIKRCIGDIPLLLDCAQSLGHEPVALDTWNIDFAAFTGHKGLHGPGGTGGFFIRNPDHVAPVVFGGTGSRSESFEMPLFAPDKFEAGTPNVVGIFGLLAALENPQKTRYTENAFIDLLQKVDNLLFLKCIRANDECNQGPLFSLIHRKYDCSHFAGELYRRFSIETRSGLHCAPLAHSSLGTFPDGTVRISLSPFHSDDDLAYLYYSLKEMESL